MKTRPKVCSAGLIKKLRADSEGTDINDITLVGPQDLSQAVIVVLSGGPFDLTNPPEVRDRMDRLISDVNADPYVLANTGGRA